MEEIINTKTNLKKDVTVPAEEKGGLACGAGGDVIPQDTSWIDDYKKAESAYNDFYKETYLYNKEIFVNLLKTSIGKFNML